MGLFVVGGKNWATSPPKFSLLAWAYLHGSFKSKNRSSQGLLRPGFGNATVPLLPYYIGQERPKAHQTQRVGVATHHHAKG